MRYVHVGHSHFSSEEDDPPPEPEPPALERKGMDGGRKVGSSLDSFDQLEANQFVESAASIS